MVFMNTQNNLQRIINIAKKTGDKVIVFDQVKPESSYVVMSFDEYEKLIGAKNVDIRTLTEDQFVEKINRDIAVWKSDNDFGVNENNFYEEILKSNEPEEREESVFSESEDMTSVKSVIDEIKEKRKKAGWNIPRERVDGAEEVMEEDRQYLEAIPF